MRQRINLLPPRPKIKRDYLQLNAVLVYVFFTALVCFLINGWLLKDVNHSEEQLQGLIVKAQQYQYELKRLEVLKSQRKPDSALINYRDELTQTVLSKQHLSGLLELIQPENQQKFSQGLLAFSNSVPDQVWLTSFKITSDALMLDIAGESADTSQIPVLLRQLAQQPFFNTMHFFELTTEKNINENHMFTAHGVIKGNAYD